MLRAAAFLAMIAVTALVSVAGTLTLAPSRGVAAEPAPPAGVALARAFPRLLFDHPLFLAAAPGGTRLYVATQDGTIRTFEPTGDPAEAPLFVDLRDRVAQRGNEEGLLGLAFHPGFARNGTFYVYYSPAEGPRRTVLSRLHAPSPERADARTEKTLLTIDQPYSNHNGGMVAFGPDGNVYVGVGDGGSAGDPHGNGQRLDTLLGKILRLTPEGGVPPDNPFVGTQGARGEIWAFGLRNPWRFSFDRETGELWAGDVGQNKWEEIDVIRRGGNYGWNVFEGAAVFRNTSRRPATDFVAPAHAYGHGLGCSVTGGYVYRGKSVPALRSHYVFADYCSGRVWALAPEGGGARVRQVATVESPSSFGEDAAGELYITSFDGGLYRFGPAR
jgi:glucose/arabinose dehydrogenase